MTGLVGSITTSLNWKQIPFRKGTYKNEMSIVFCETSGNNNYVWLRWIRGEISSYLYFNYPILAYDTYPRDNSPFKITLNLNDIIEVKSTIPGIDVSFVS